MPDRSAGAPRGDPLAPHAARGVGCGAVAPDGGAYPLRTQGPSHVRAGKSPIGVRSRDSPRRASRAARMARGPHVGRGAGRVGLDEPRGDCQIAGRHRLLRRRARRRPGAPGAVRRRTHDRSFASPPELRRVFAVKGRGGRMLQPAVDHILSQRSLPETGAYRAQHRRIAREGDRAPASRLLRPDQSAPRQASASHRRAGLWRAAGARRTVTDGRP